MKYADYKIKGTAKRAFQENSDKVTYLYPGGSYKHTQFMKHTNVIETGEVTITININKLIAALGERALASKRGVAGVLRGVIKAKITSPRSREVTHERGVSLPAGATIITTEGEKE